MHDGFIPMIYSHVSDVYQSISKFTGLFLSLSGRFMYQGLWAHQGTVQILNVTQINRSADRYNFFVLCTKDTMPLDQPTCSSTSFQCSDGTCLDEHLVCDGRQHCMMGEDEKECTNTCTDKVSCALNCSYMNKCYCLRGFFQCKSGGCIPVGKLCDSVYNCKHGSDEPMSCEFDSAQRQKNNIEEHWKVLRQRYSQGTDSKLFVVNSFDLNPPEVTNYNTNGDGKYELYYGLGITYLICFDEDKTIDVPKAPRYFLDNWCIYGYSLFADIGYAHFPCTNDYHLSSCEHMYCIDTFKCMKSYCLKWKYVCDHSCDCPHCEDENICENVSCPGMILHESAHGKVYCNEQADSRLAAVLIQSSSYDLYMHTQSEMCAQVLNCKGNITTRNNIVYLDLLHGDHLGDNTHVTVEMMEFLIYCNITYYNLGDEDAKYLTQLTHNNIGDKCSNIFGRMNQLLYLDLSSNHFTFLKKSFLWVSSNLTYLFLQNNKISYIEYDAFYFTRKLSTLYLQGNVFLSKSVDFRKFSDVVKFINFIL